MPSRPTKSFGNFFLISLLLFPLLSRRGSDVPSLNGTGSAIGIAAIETAHASQSAASSAEMQFVPEPTSRRPNGPPPTPLPQGDVASIGVMAALGEPGERLIVSGHVFAPDGARPAPGVLVYAYQTDAGGEYHNDPNTHVARLHGWAKTDSEGGFEFRTIKPGPYPGRAIPAHIHFHAWGGGYPLQWTPDLNFAGDPLLKPPDISSSAAAGKFGSVQETTRGPDGALQCSFNIRLSSITNYK